MSKFFSTDTTTNKPVLTVPEISTGLITCLPLATGGTVNKAVTTSPTGVLTSDGGILIGTYFCPNLLNLATGTQLIVTSQCAMWTFVFQYIIASSGLITNGVVQFSTHADTAGYHITPFNSTTNLTVTSPSASSMLITYAGWPQMAFTLNNNILYISAQTITVATSMGIRYHGVTYHNPPTQ